MWAHLQMPPVTAYRKQHLLLYERLPDKVVNFSLETDTVSIALVYG